MCLISIISSKKIVDICQTTRLTYLGATMIPGTQGLTITTLLKGDGGSK